MAKSPAPSAKTSTRKTPTPKPSTPDPSITTIKKATCKTLTGSSTLTYRLGVDKTSTLHWQILSSDGGGYFSNEWVAFQEIQQALSDWAEDFPITSMALKVFRGRSVNTSAFLLATLVKEGILEPVPDRKRHYQLCDPKPFLAAVEKLKVTHSKPGKAKPRAKGKAVTRMSPGEKKPAAKK
jgi:hypothetical protein